MVAGQMEDLEAVTDNARHAHLWATCRKLPQDYRPYGETDREADDYQGDCSGGCRFFFPLANEHDGRVTRDGDWGVCTNPGSHRVGLLTFEHQGCGAFVHEDDDPSDPDA